jgi:aldehyde dehydrogenase (NAD+)
MQNLSEFYGENPQNNPDYSRIISERHVTRIEGLLKEHGGKLVTGGESDVKDRYFAPTIIEDPNIKSKLMEEEIFGPILPVLEIDNVDEAIQFINEREKPLALYLFSTNSSVKTKVREQTSSGAFVLNDVVVHNTVPELPFGGVGHSGMGSYHGKKTFEVFSHEKACLERGTFIDPSVRYPPYTEGKLTLLRFAFYKFDPFALVKKLIPLVIVGVAVAAFFKLSQK